MNVGRWITTCASSPPNSALLSLGRYRVALRARTLLRRCSVFAKPTEQTIAHSLHLLQHRIITRIETTTRGCLGCEREWAWNRSSSSPVALLARDRFSRHMGGLCSELVASGVGGLLQIIIMTQLCGECTHEHTCKHTKVGKLEA